MEKENIGIIGQGFVGNSVKEGFKNDYNILTYDLKPELCNCASMRNLVKECYVIFLCLPTPMQKDGSCYVGILEEAVKNIAEMGVINLLVIKSTVPPTTIDYFEETYGELLSFIYNPEFLTEANAVNDFKDQDRIILGCSDHDTFTCVADIYRKSFPLVIIIKTTFDEAIMVKYMTNAFLAMKVIFANEMYDLCKELGIDYNIVYNVAVFDKRLGESHWTVPGPDGDRGFGGHCFPKDLSAIRYVAEQKGVDTRLLNAVSHKNDKIRKNRDWERQKGRAVI